MRRPKCGQRKQAAPNKTDRPSLTASKTSGPLSGPHRDLRFSTSEARNASVPVRSTPKRADKVGCKHL